jgi:hypothetical protein
MKCSSKQRIPALPFPSLPSGLHFPEMKPTPVLKATNDELERYLGVGDDTRRAILRALGLPKRRRHAWSEIWARLGLEPVQPDEVMKHLMLGPRNENALWDADRVADETGYAVDTVHGRCRKQAFHDGFPRPILDFSSKTRLWLPLDVRAYIEPTIYGDLAAKVCRRAVRTEKKPPVAAPVVLHGTLQPLPPRGEVAAA